jgi:glycosyltransferase involved in cell wall biosynthesis
MVLAHDSVTVPGGGERTLDVLLAAFRSAPLYTTIFRPTFPLPGLGDRAIRRSPLHHLRLPAPLLKPLFPAAFEAFRLGADVELVLSSSSGYAKGLRAPRGVPHLSYVHTPIRRVWNPYHRAARRTPGGPVGRRVERLLLAYLRRWDLRSMARVDHLVTNSKNTALQIQRIYGREASIVHPPVRTSFFNPAPRQSGKDYLLVVGRLDPYKRVDLAIGAARTLGTKLVVVGTGVEAARLRQLADGRVWFTGNTDDVTLRELYRGCRALVFPGEEDFGIVPVEAQACGRPVVAFGAGGALETVVDGLTGVLFHDPSVDALVQAIERAGRIDFDRDQLRLHALQFDEGRFRARMVDLASRVTCRGAGS